MRVLYDSVLVSRIPHNAQMVAGYVGGAWPTFDTLAGIFPDAVVVSIAVDTSHDAMVLDVETGDARPQQAVGWVTRQRAQGKIPTVYCNTSTWPAVKAAFSIAGEPLPLWWRADFNGKPLLEMGEIAHQYTNGQTPVSAPNRVTGCDTSVVADHWPGVDEGDTDMTPEQAAQTAATNQAVGRLEVAVEDPTSGLRKQVADLTGLVNRLITKLGA